MELTMDDAIRRKLDACNIYQVRTGMWHIREANKYRWGDGEKIYYNAGCSIEPFSTFASGNNLYTCGSFSSIASSLPANTVVGRYTEIAVGCSMMGFRHPIESVSINSATFNFARENIASYFEQYEGSFGVVTKKGVPIPQPQLQPLVIGNDVWIGDNCKLRGGITIHDGAVIASNSVVVKDVPPYAIVAGVPAKIKKFRFPPEIIQGLLESKWWEYELGDMYRENLDFSSPMDFLNRFNIVKGRLRKYNPKVFVPIVDFNDSKFCVEEGCLITHWGTALKLNFDLENPIVHNDIQDKDDYVKLSLENRLVYQNKLLDGKNTGLSDVAQQFEIVKNADASISLKIRGMYLSARPNGDIEVVAQNQDWEKFYVVKYRM